MMGLFRRQKPPEPMEAAAVVLRGVRVGTILSDISAVIQPGACVGVIGVNGAGKSTLLAAMAGVLQPDAGVIEGTEHAAYLPEGFRVDPTIRVRQWLSMARNLPGWNPEVGGALAQDMRLPADARVSGLSQGQRLRLGLILTLGRDAPCYLLDDPFLGLDPVGRTHAERWLARRSEDATVILAAQDTEIVERLCTDLLLLDGGRVLGWGELESWRTRFVSVRVTGELQALRAVSGRVLQQQQRGPCHDLILDDADGQVRAVLSAAGVNVKPRPLRLDELITAMVTS